jgi:hypothetical protein
MTREPEAAGRRLRATRSFETISSMFLLVSISIRGRLDEPCID